MTDNVRRVTVVHPNGGQKTTVEVPSDVTMQRLVPALASRMSLPNVDQSGQPVEYRLAYRRGAEERALNADETFASAEVQNDDVLRLYADLRAGAPGIEPVQ